MPRHKLLALVVLGTLASVGLADEASIRSRIESVDLFKNGLAVVTRSVEVPKAGTYRIDESIDPVHGTFWIHSERPVTCTTTWREVEELPVTKGDVDFQQDLVGKRVTIRLQDGDQPIKGVVAQLARPKGDDAWARTYNPDPYGYRYANPVAPSRYLILETEDGRSYVELSRIAHLVVESTSRKIRQLQPVLLLEVGDKPEAGNSVKFSYLARGLTWAPSYRVDLADPKRLSIEQQAAVKNELEDLDRVAMRLISGYPSIQMDRVVSPLSLKSNLAKFFQELATADNATSPSPLYGNAMMQNARPTTPSDDLSAGLGNEGIDLHFHSIGRRSLGEGDAMSLTTATAKADYERIVEWIVPDTRNEMGSYRDRDRNADRDRDAAWDAVRFRNPFSFPMTTGPCMVTTAGSFAGQRTSFWVNPGEETTVRITKSLSIRTLATEFEQYTQRASGISADREQIVIGGHSYTRAHVQGELTVNNHRNEEVKVLIRRQFSGDLVKADENPKVVLRHEGLQSLNPRNELLWTIVLQPGEEKRLKYDYRVLVW